MTLFPNPSSGLLTVFLSSGFSEDTRFSIYNMEGHLIYDETYSGIKQCVINLSDIKSGVYVIRVQSGNNTLSRKIMLLE